MATDPLIKVNGKNWTGRVLTPFKIGRHRLWADDSGRVMSGKMTGTMIGIFPKLTVIFYPETPQEMREMTTEFDKPSQKLEAFDPKTGKLKALGTYSGDYEISIANFFGYTNYEVEPITVSFISIEKEK